MAGGKKDLRAVDKNLSCDTCSRHFIDETHLKEHKCAHLKCDICDATFIREGLKKC